MGDIDIFAYNSQNSGIIGTSLVWSFSSYITYLYKKSAISPNMFL